MNDANVSYFSPDKRKVFLSIDYFLLVKKATSGSSFALQKGKEKLVTNSWIISN
jgi:hypothetical protein